MCLVGDAGSVAPPFTGSGVFKAVQNAIDLSKAITSTKDIDGSLEEWSRRQTETGHRLAALGQQMEEAFVWSAPDFAQMLEEETRLWWQQAISFPDDFSYVRHSD
jgi:2-polyprenyl-6-methoxyphenol hydroxylase-like FAD-dependent oxidoreductase